MQNENSPMNRLYRRIESRLERAKAQRERIEGVRSAWKLREYLDGKIEAYKDMMLMMLQYLRD